MKFAILGLLIVLFIAFLVSVFKAAKNWRWYHITTACITMILAIALIFPTAVALKSRVAWHKVKEDLVKRAEQAVTEQKQIKYGDLNDPTGGDGIIALNQRLSRIGVEAGRTWRNLAMQAGTADSVTLTRQVAEPAPTAEPAPATDAPADGAAAPLEPLPMIPPAMIVYGFAETPIEIGGQATATPTFFLGEFNVATSSPNEVTLTPTGPLDPAQVERITNDASSWSLYELLPLDGHQMFIAAGSVESDENVFGRVDEVLVKQLLEGNVREQTLNNYLRDGTRVDPQNPPSPLSRWTKVEFTSKHSFDVDSLNQSGALEGGFFDGGGRAVDSRLQRGADDPKVQFEVGERLVLKEEAANEIIASGVARRIDTYYVRPLNDYRYVLRKIGLRLQELEIRSQRLDFEKQVLEKAIAATDAMLVTNQSTELNLEQDRDQLRVENQALTSYHNNLQQQVSKTRQTLVHLYQRNNELEQQLTQIAGDVNQLAP